MQKLDYLLEKPEPARDSAAFLSWPIVIGQSIELSELVEREQQQELVGWVIRTGDKTVGAVWIELLDTDYLDVPSVHFVIGDPEYVASGIAEAVLKDALRYAYGKLPYALMHARHVVTDKTMEKSLKKLGFEPDAKAYVDDAGQQWQNMKVVL